MGAIRATFAVSLGVISAALWPGAAVAAFSPPLPVSGVDAAAKGPAVAQDGAASQYVAWVRASDHHVIARRVGDDGALGAALDLSGEGSKSDTTAAVAVADPSGNVTVVWMRAGDQHVVAARIPAGGSPGAVIDVSQGSVAASSQSNAAADGLGNVHVVWRNGSNSHVTTRTLAPGGTVSAATDVSSDDAEAALWGTAPAVAADAAGNRFFTYHRNSDCHIMLRGLSSGGALGPAIDVSQQPDKAVGDTSPAVAVAGSNVLVAWHRDGDIFDHADDTAYYSFVAGGTTPGAPTQLGAAGDVSMMGIGAAGGPDGAFGVTWQGRTSGQVWYRAVGAGGAPAGDAVQLSASASAADAAPGVGIGPTASVAVVWTDAGGAVNFTSSKGTYAPPVKPPVLLKMALRGSVAVKGGRFVFKVRCLAAASCAGKVLVTNRSGRTTWAKGALKVGAGKTIKVKLRPSRAGRAALRRKGALRGRLRLGDGAAARGYSFKLKRR